MTVLLLFAAAVACSAALAAALRRPQPVRVRARR
jgi:hypothetical protein